MPLILNADLPVQFLVQMMSHSQRMLPSWAITLLLYSQSGEGGGRERGAGMFPDERRLI